MAVSPLHSFVIHGFTAETVVPVVTHHVVEDFSAGEVIFYARLLVSFGGSCGV